MQRAVLTIAYGTVDDLDDLPAFLTAIRRGNAPPPAMVAEVRRRYLAIGGRSPLNEICRDVTRRIGERLGLRAAFAGRMWGPTPADVLAELGRAGATQVVVLPLAPYSARDYVETVRVAAKALTMTGKAGIDVVGPDNWGQEPRLTEAFAASLSRAVAALPESTRRHARVLMSAHSLPLAVARAGDAYERDVRASADAVALAVGRSMLPHEVVFQSQGLGGGEWLGPDVRTTLDRLAAEGVTKVIFAPIGFLADHAEVLYDLDVEARGWAEARGMEYARAGSLNASDGLIDALEVVARRLCS
jgi:ferrochelatase